MSKTMPAAPISDRERADFPQVYAASPEPIPTGWQVLIWRVGKTLNNERNHVATVYGDSWDVAKFRGDLMMGAINNMLPDAILDARKSVKP